MAHPLATYRLQLTEDVPFARAAELVPYLSDLGISHLYLSPVLQARPGSRHFYNVADHSRVDDDLGGIEGLRQLADTAHAAGLGLIGDIVPNHMGVGPWSPLWDRLLQEGRSSEIARFFDIDWDSPLPGSKDKVILPALDQPYGDALEEGRIGVVEEDDSFRITYGEVSFPVNRESATALSRSGTSGLDGTPGSPRTWSRMHALLEQQHYRLVSRRAGRRLVNYRRFFDVDELAALKVEADAVFDATHELMVSLVRDGVLDGLRVDHIDGLADPTRYLQRLREAIGADAWLVVEALTSAEEGLPEDWPVDGTTGYETLRTTMGLQVDPAGWNRLRGFAATLDAVPDSVDLFRTKAEVLDSSLGTDVRRVARAFWEACQDEPRVRDVDYRTLLEAIASLAASMTRYRTYIDPEDGSISARDAEEVRHTVSRARELIDRGEVPDRLWDHLEAMLTGEVRWTAATGDAVTRFQQLTSGVIGVGVEQRLFGRHQAMVAGCELGSDPSAVARDLATAHAEIQSMPPHGMRTTATHDTLLGEDVRQRVIALTGVADSWIDELPTLLHGAPDRAFALRLLQVAVGLWPVEDDGSQEVSEVLSPSLGDRLADYAVAWARKQATRTNARSPHEEYEADLRRYAATLLDPTAEAALRLRPLAIRAGAIGLAASLSQALVRLTVPGIPDTYQGTEWWDDSLSDPDNRRVVDFDARREALATLASTDAAQLWASRRDGRVKQHIVATALRLRQRQPDTLGPLGEYTPVLSRGRWTNHMHAYERRAPGVLQGAPGTVVVVAPRVYGRVTDGGRYDPIGRIWADTDLLLPGQARWVDQFTGQTVQGGAVPVAGLLRTLPVALLVAEPDTT